MLRGSLVALVTPMHEDGSLDWTALDGLVDWHIEQGSHGLVAMGTTGESATLEMNDHLKVIEHIVKRTAGRLPVVAGTGANSTSEALELTQGAKNSGADACLLVTPYYNKPTQEGLYLHHAQLADAVAIPQILYNVPGRTAVDMLPETVARLAKIDNIIGIKDATGSMDRLRAMQPLVNDDFLFFSGDDETSLTFVELGGHGAISVTANIVPALLARMCDAALLGNAEEAVAINRRLMPLHKALFLESNPIPVKWALQYMQRIQSGIRLPMTPLSQEYHLPLQQAMEAAGVMAVATL